MTGTQKSLRKIQDELEEVERRSAELLSQDELNEEGEKEIRELASKKQKLIETRSAVRLLLDEDEKKSIVLDNGLDAEQRERIDLRSKASLTEFFKAAAQGRMPSGAELELRQAAGVSGIPLEIFDVPGPAREKRATADPPGTVGVNLDPILPAVFANSIAPRLGIQMPRVGSGTYASATISTSQGTSALAKSGAAAGVAGAMTVTTATPKRVSARLELALEDIAAVGQANFESILRENLSLALSDALDTQSINGDGAAPNLTGMFSRLTDPTGSAPTDTATFDDFVDLFAGGIDGLWASMANEVAIVVNPESYRLSLKSFRDPATGTAGGRGDMSFADYAMQNYGGWWTNKRMPDPASNISQAILYRKGRSMQGGNAGMRTAVCPHWNEISIDDIYSGSAKAERYFTMHVLLGDVIITQPGAYAQVQLKSS